MFPTCCLQLCVQPNRRGRLAVQVPPPEPHGTEADCDGVPRDGSVLRRMVHETRAGPFFQESETPSKLSGFTPNAPLPPSGSYPIGSRFSRPIMPSSAHFLKPGMIFSSGAGFGSFQKVRAFFMPDPIPFLPGPPIGPLSLFSWPKHANSS